MTKLKQLDPEIKSGCMNDERTKKDMPDEIIINTCSGFDNHGQEGTWVVGDNESRGINEWKYTGKVNNIERAWLTHSALMNGVDADKVESEMKKMTKGVFGVVSHANSVEFPEYSKFMDKLSALDPDGKNSLTLIAASKLNLTAKTLTEQQLGPNGGTSGGTTPPPGNGSTTHQLCGDNICDAFEKSNPLVCPQDCN